MKLGSAVDKSRRAGALVKEYGTGYVVKRTIWRKQFTHNPERHISYEEWRRLNTLTVARARNERRRYEQRAVDAPRFLVAVDTEGKTEEALARTKASVRRQTWLPEKVFIGKGASVKERMGAYLQEQDREQFWVLRIPAGDELENEFFYRFAQAIQKDQSKMLWYTDREVWKAAHVEDDAHQVYLLPDYSEDYLCAWDYIGAAFVTKCTLLGEALDGLLEPSYLFLLTCAADTGTFGHVPGLLYHVKQYDAAETEQKASDEQIDEQIRRIYMNADSGDQDYTLTDVQILPGPSRTRRVRLCWKEKPQISVIIPNKDHVEDLMVCLKSLQKQTVRQQLEVLIVENNSEDQKTFDCYKWLETGERAASLKDMDVDEALRTDLKIRVLYWKEGFNYSAINNFAAKKAAGDYLLLLNNDVELIGEDAIAWLLSSGMQKDVGIVGAKLYYEDETVQHGGVIVGFRGVGGHAFAGLSMNDSGYMNQADCVRRLSAVTAACLLVRKSVYMAVGGLEEGYAVAFNDVDFCLKVFHTGAKILYQPACEGWHAESKSRGQDLEGEKLRRFQQEIRLFLNNWHDFLQQGDPYYNANLSLMHADFVSYREPYAFDEQF